MVNPIECNMADQDFTTPNKWTDGIFAKIEIPEGLTTNVHNNLRAS